MIIGLGLDARLGLTYGEFRQLGVEAAVLGFESLWTPSGHFPETFHLCAAWSGDTAGFVEGGLRTGIAVVPAPRSWQPGPLALQAATVAAGSFNQFVLGIGTGGTGAAFFRAAGLPNRPLTVMRDYLSILRTAFSDGRVDYAGEAVSLRNFHLTDEPLSVPVYLAALGPQMLGLAGSHADGASLNWATPDQIEWSRAQVGAGAQRAGRDAGDVTISMYIRVCVDDDVAAARRALAGALLGYAMARPGADPAHGYRGHFARMGWDAELRRLEGRRDAGASITELADDASEEFVNAFGYYGTPDGAAARFRQLATGLDEAIVRVVTARPGPEAARAAMLALTPGRIRA